jgi:flagellar protein FlgJ
MPIRKTDGCKWLSDKASFRMEIKTNGATPMDIITTGTLGLKENSNSADTIKERKLREACAGFEAIMLKEMLSLARRSVPKSGLWEGGHAQDIYESMHDDFLTQELAGGEGMGFGEMLYRQLSKGMNPVNHGNK